MSILLGPYETSSSERKAASNDEELFVFGYACKLYRDDGKALLEDSGALLIPWMGDNSLMVDRYDIRNRLEDKALFGLKPNFPHKLTQEEEEFEELLDKERYSSLGCDILEEELAEEERKRRAERELSAVPFSYNSSSTAPPVQEHLIPVCYPQLPDHPPTSSVDYGQDDAFVLPPGLKIPPETQLPITNKVNSIIERTALFISQQGQQMEIIIKTKQRHNPFFSFLDHEDALHPYYRCVLQAISSGLYFPATPSAAAENNNSNKKRCDEDNNNNNSDDKPVGGEEGGNRTGGDSGKCSEEGAGNGSGSEDSEDSDDDEGFELHPLLRASAHSSAAASSAKANAKPAISTASSASASSVSSDMSEGERHSSEHGKPVFSNAVLSVNSAPAVSEQNATLVDPGAPHHLSGSFVGDPMTSGVYQQGSHPYDAYSHDMQVAGYQYNLQAFYHALSEQAVGARGCTPPPPDLQPVVDKTAEYVAKNDELFERTVLEKHCDDARFGFLNPWNQYYAYYQSKKRFFKERMKAIAAHNEQVLSKHNVQRLSSTGSVSFKLAPVSTKSLALPRPDFSTEHETEGEKNTLEDVGVNGIQETEEEEEEEEKEEEEPPAPKRQRMENEESEAKMDNKVHEFLSRVKKMFGAD